MQVEIYSRYPRVQLYLNDKLIGEKPTTRDEQFKATFSVPYAPGVLRAVALGGDKEAQRMELTTVGEVAGLRLTADRSQLTADGQDLAFITVESVDAQGRFQPNGNQSVSFKVEGAGTLAGVANGDYSNTDGYQSSERKLFNGRAQLIVRTGKNAGPISISAEAKDVKSAYNGTRDRGKAFLIEVSWIKSSWVPSIRKTTCCRPRKSARIPSTRKATSRKTCSAEKSKSPPNPSAPKRKGSITNPNSNTTSR